MDGFQSRLNDSLQRRLLLWLSLVIVGVALVAGVVSFYLAFNEAHELQDDMLRQNASLFGPQNLPASPTASQARDSDTDTRLLVAPLSSQTVNRGSDSRVRFPADLANGFQTRSFGGENYRIFVKPLGPNERIAVAQQTAVRDEAARNSALMALLPFCILVPILVLVVVGVVRAVFAPVALLSAEVDGRREQDLQPVSAARLPREIRPFVVAINGLLQRVAESMAMQQRFVAAAAHELRSPLTALSLQAERLAASDMSAVAQQRLNTLRQGIARNRALLDQLLAFARAQAVAPAPARPTSIHRVFRSVVSALMPLAESKHLDISVASESDVAVVVSEADLAIAVNNLLTNAIRYTPPSGRILLFVTETAAGVALVVEDNGPGVAESERARVFEPFYRRVGSDVGGSGLGLSIVKTIVDQLGGDVALDDALASATGLRATITLPNKSADSGRDERRV